MLFRSASTGRVVCIGYAKNDIKFTTKLWVRKELDILGSRNADTDNFKEVLSLLSSGSFPSEEVISKIVSPEEAADAFKEWSENPVKIFKILLRF